MSRAILRVLPYFVLLGVQTLGMLALASAQEPKPAEQASGAVAGRVTIAGKPARGVVVLLTADRSEPLAVFEQLTQGKAAHKALTDDDGRYRVAELPPGKYVVAPFLPAYIGADLDDDKPQRPVTVDSGKTVEGVDFELVRGGVITGRVTHSDGRPVIGQRVRVARIPEDPQSKSETTSGIAQAATDDRGVYRAYGLRPGRYRVSVGGSAGVDLRSLFKGPFTTETFHPGTTDPNSASVIEVGPATEIRDVDIKLGQRSASYKATGRIIDAATGKPVSNVMTACTTAGGEATPGDYGIGVGAPSNDRGEFRIEGLRPGHYVLVAALGTDRPSDYYSEAVQFEVTNRDVSNLEIKLRVGASISGRAVLEGTEDQAIIAKLAHVELFAVQPKTDGDAGPSFARSKITGDGNFELRGLAPGKVIVRLLDFFGPQGFEILRTEHNGALKNEGFDLSAGEKLTGVTVVVGYGTNTIRGRVIVEGGKLPDGVELGVEAVRTDGDDFARILKKKSAKVDEAGNFALEGLVAGEYELMLHVTPADTGKPSQPQRPIPPLSQKVTVINGVPAEVTFVLDLGAVLKSRKP